MADLQQVIGAILRDLAKARFSSDLYSRSISRYYENDYLLRKFPVPRSEIEEVEIDLKFSIADVVDSSVNTEGREANVAFRLERTVESLVATLLDLACDYSEASADSETQEQLRKVFTKGFRSTALRIELRQKALRYLIESYTHLIDENGTFNSERAIAGLLKPMKWGFQEYRAEGVPESEGYTVLDPLFDYVFKQKAFRNKVESLVDPIRDIWRHNSDTQLEIEVSGQKLAELSEAAISSIKIKAVVRNHVWTEVKVDERTYRHALTSE